MAPFPQKKKNNGSLKLQITPNIIMNELAHHQIAEEEQTCH